MALEHLHSLSTDEFNQLKIDASNRRTKITLAIKNQNSKNLKTTCARDY